MAASAPAAAVLWARSLVAGRRLRPTPTGFVLDGALEPPPDLLALAAAEVREVTAGPLGVPAAVLAALGPAGSLAEAERACGRLEVRLGPALLRLERDGLVRVDGRGFVFELAPAREVVLAALDEAGRRAVHAACAEAVSDPAARGAHLLGAGRPDEAFPAWVAAAEARSRRGELVSALGAVGRMEEALDVAGAGPDDPHEGGPVDLRPRGARAARRLPRAERA